MKNKLTTVFAISLFLTFSYFIFKTNKQNKVSNFKMSVNDKDVVNKTLAEKKPHYDKIITANSEEIRLAQVAAENHIKYFNQVLLTNDDVKEKYNSALSVLGSHAEAKLVAEYIAEGAARESSAEFSNYMQQLMADLNNGSDDIYRLILSKEHELQKDRFQYQMVLNLAYAMQMPNKAKARVLGGALAVPFASKAAGDDLEASTNITNAMILLKNSKMSNSIILPYLKLGMIVNKKDKSALQQYQSRANAYFPEMIDRPVIK